MKIAVDFENLLVRVQYFIYARFALTISVPSKWSDWLVTLVSMVTMRTLAGETFPKLYKQVRVCRFIYFVLRTDTVHLTTVVVHVTTHALTMVFFILKGQNIFIFFRHGTSIKYSLAQTGEICTHTCHSWQFWLTRILSLRGSNWDILSYMLNFTTQMTCRVSQFFPRRLGTSVGYNCQVWHVCVQSAPVCARLIAEVIRRILFASNAIQTIGIAIKNLIIISLYIVWIVFGATKMRRITLPLNTHLVNRVSHHNVFSRDKDFPN